MSCPPSPGGSTPLSPTSTLSAPPSPGLSGLSVRAGSPKPTLANYSQISASIFIEHLASRVSVSSTVFVYDLAEQAGFGTFTRGWARTDPETAPVVNLQTRPGAGLGLVGRLSQSTSRAASTNAILTVYNTPSGLASMMHSLSYLPPPTPTSRLVIQVPTITPIGENLALSPTLAPFTPVFPILPKTTTVLLSATSQEAVDLAALSYKLTDTHVIHFFDHYGTTREIGRDIVPTVTSKFHGTTLADHLASTGYKFFDYVGDDDAHTVIVALGGPLSQAAKSVALRTPGLGVVSVRVLRPWKEDALRESIPPSARTIYVVDDVPVEFAQGHLFLDVYSSLLDPLTLGPVVRPLRITPSRLQGFLTSPSSFTTFVVNLLPSPAPVLSDEPGLKKLLFFNTPGSTLAPLAGIVKNTLTSSSLDAYRLTDCDALSQPDGVVSDRVVVVRKGQELSASLHFYLPISSEPGDSDFLSVLDQSLLRTYSIASHAKPGSPVLVIANRSPAELVPDIHPTTLLLMRDRRLHLCTINVKEIAERLATSAPKRDVAQNIIAYLAFLRLYLGKAGTEQAVLALALKTVSGVAGDIDMVELAQRAWAGLVQVDLSLQGAAEVNAGPLKVFEFNAVAVDTTVGDSLVHDSKLGSWHDAAKHIIFPSAFTPTMALKAPSDIRDPALRPEVPEHTYLVTCTVNHRLTPLEYDRNVFHLEFDTQGTGLKYEIGEALGVHGWNDTQEVLDFCQWYGVDPDQTITIPLPGDDGAQMHTRTVFQVLQQQIDLFGKPGKAFYDDLAEYATHQCDRYALRFIASPEGSSTFKKLSEKDTVTFVDILQRYPSSRPRIERLCEMIGDTKPRHYSIASAQAVVGDRVDLLVVSVDWATPSGTMRYGQCTRYLAGLRVGQKVTVSVRPSVMKLPPDHSQPVIMAGLGTGAAPFRAFLQYRAFLAAQGTPVGPTFYYFGSRHRSQEYLYGEEIEAFILDRTITRAGLAFSRDQKQKVYIQDKMREDGRDLVRMLLKENGVFYLCGPTWPVPDVFEALVAALEMYEGVEAGKAGKFLEGLKEEERYVLEVY